MIALWILGGIVLLVICLLFLRVGVMAEYGGAQALLFVRVGFLRFRFAPKEKPEEKTRAKGKRKKQKQEQPAQAAKTGGPMQLVKAFLPVVKEGVSRLRARLRVDLLEVEYRSGGSDAAKAAIGFGRASAAIGIVLPVLEQLFEVKEKRVRAWVDYALDKPAVYLKLSLSMRVYQALSLALWFGREYMQWKAETAPSEQPASNTDDLHAETDGALPKPN